MGEYDRRIAVLRNLRGGALDLGDQRLDIPRADERGEFRTESQLLAPEIADLADTGMEHEALAQKPRRIAQKRPLLLAGELRGIFGPGDQFEVPVIVAQTHEAAKKVEMLLAHRIALARHQMAQFQQIAACQARHVAGLQRIGHAPLLRHPLQHVGRDARHADLLRTRNDRRQQAVGMFADQDEKRAIPRLLQNLEDLVRGLLVHRLRKPDQHGLIVGLETLERQFADDLVGLAGRDHAFERLAQVETVVPVLRREVAPALGEQRAELRQELVAAHHLSRLLALFVDRENQMQVGVRQRRDLSAVGAFAARVAARAVAAAEILDIGHGHGQRPGTRRTREELGMAHATGIDRLRQMPFQILLSCNVRKTHFTPYFSSAGRSAPRQSSANPRKPPRGSRSAPCRAPAGAPRPRRGKARNWRPSRRFFRSSSSCSVYFRTASARMIRTSSSGRPTESVATP